MNENFDSLPIKWNFDFIIQNCGKIFAFSMVSMEFHLALFALGVKKIKLEKQYGYDVNQQFEKHFIE